MSESMKKKTHLFGQKPKLWAIIQLEWYIKPTSHRSHKAKPGGGKTMESKSLKKTKLFMWLALMNKVLTWEIMQRKATWAWNMHSV